MSIFQRIIDAIFGALQIGIRRPRNMKKVLLDAGHGGRDSGAVAGKIEEKDIALDVVLDMGQVLGRRPDIEVYYTRMGDVSMSLTSRYQAIMDIKPDAFVSVHCNAIADNPATPQDECRTVHGTEVFYRNAQDLPLANAINHLFRHSGIWRKHRGVKQDQEWLQKRLTVLNSLEVPSVLVEIGFISNPGEREMILEHGMVIADLLAHGIIDFLQEKDENV